RQGRQGTSKSSRDLWAVQMGRRSVRGPIDVSRFDSCRVSRVFYDKPNVVLNFDGCKSTAYDGSLLKENPIGAQLDMKRQSIAFRALDSQLVSCQFFCC